VERYQEAAEADANTKMIEVIKSEVETRLAQWTIQYDAYQKSEGSELETMMEDIAVNWGARQVFSLENELEVRTHGVDAYLKAYREKKLSWQCVPVFE